MTRRNFISAAGLGIISRGISIAIRFISVPLAISLLTQEKYGLWLIAGSVVGWFGFSDLGIPLALQNRLIHVLSAEGIERGRAVVTYALRMMCIIGGIMAVFGCAIAIAAPWGRLFKIQPSFHWEFVGTLCFCSFGFAIGLPARIGAVIYYAHGKLFVPPIGEIAGQLSSLIMLLCVVWLHWRSLFGLVGSYLAGIVFGSLMLTVLACKSYGYSFRSRKVMHEDRKELIGKGIFFLLDILGKDCMFYNQSNLIVVC